MGLPGGGGFRRHGGGTLAGPGLPAARGGRCRGPDPETGHHRPESGHGVDHRWRDDSTYGTAGRERVRRGGADGETAWTTGWRTIPARQHRTDDASGAGCIRIGTPRAGPSRLYPDPECRGCRGFPPGRGRRVPEHHGVPAGAAADQRRRGPPQALPRRGSPAAAGILRRPLAPGPGNSVPPSPPARSRPGPRPSSPWPWTVSGTPATPRPPPGWSTP